MLLLRIDRSSASPVYRQVIDGIARLVEDGTLAPGDRLPSTRALARRLGLNRFTLYRAYEELQSLGYVESRPGSYTTVRKRARLAPEAPARRGAIDWRRAVAPAASDVHAACARLNADFLGPARGDGLIDLARLDLETRLAPVKDFQRAANRVLAETGAEALRYGSAQGYEPLREYIAARLRAHGVAASAKNILVTNGAMQALDIVFRLFAAPGARAAVESPTYSIVLPNLRFYGFSIDEVPMREDGMDLDALERVVERRRPAFVYTVPNFHNPTGVTTSQEHRERLLDICGRGGAPIIEDGFEEEMKYFGKAVLPVKSMDAGQIVIYVGTFSKVLFPGLRIGWITAHEDCVERLAAMRRFADLSTSTFAQAVLDRFCRDGSYEKHLRRLNRAFRKRMEAALEAMERHMPAGVAWTKPAGGYTIWVKLPRAHEDRTLREAMRANGVRVSLGRFYYAGRRRSDSLRVSIATLDESGIVEGVRRLGRMLEAVGSKRGG